MAKKGKSGSKKKNKKPKKAWRTRTWVVARRELPMGVPGMPGRPELRVVLERPGLLLVGHAFDEPGQPGSLAEVVVTAADEPMAGPPRWPDRIVCPDANQAKELREELEAMGHGRVPVAVAEAPDLDRVLAEMGGAAQPAAEPPPLSYFDEGVGHDLVAELFAASAALYQSAPWERLSPDDLLRLDCAPLGLDGACALVTGQMGENHALLLFPSLEGYEAFLRAGSEGMAQGSRAGGIGSSLLALSFDRASDLPRKMRKEAVRHGWPVPNASAYPWVQLRGEDGYLLPTRPKDVRTIVSAARALTSYLDVLDQSPAGEEPLSVGVGEHTVTIGLFPEEEPTVHERDRFLCSAIAQAADERFGDRLESAVQRAFPHADESFWMSLGMPWVAHVLELDGRRLAEWFTDEEPNLSEGAKAHLEAQRQAWYSAWEVVDVDPGSTLTLVDHLTGEERVVHEVEGSKSVPVRSTIFARLLDYEGQTYLVGFHERYLGPSVADAVVQAMRKYLRRKKVVPPERLRNPKTSRALIRIWTEAVEADDERRAEPPELQNTDGDPILLTEDRFAFERKNAAAIRRGIEAMEGILPDDEDDHWALSRPGNPVHAHWDNTIVAQLELTKGTLRVHTNSIRRADEARAAIDEALGDLVRFRTRSHDDPTAAPALEAMRARGGKRPRHDDDPETPQEVLEAMRQFKAQHYATWADEPVPALGGKTPRQATRTKAGRHQVDLLLREMEHHEQAVPPAERFDFGVLRRELGL